MNIKGSGIGGQAVMGGGMMKNFVEAVYPRCVQFCGFSGAGYENADLFGWIF